MVEIEKSYADNIIWVWILCQYGPKYPPVKSCKITNVKLDAWSYMIGLD